MEPVLTAKDFTGSRPHIGPSRFCPRSMIALGTAPLSSASACSGGDPAWSHPAITEGDLRDRRSAVTSIPHQPPCPDILVRSLTTLRFAPIESYIGTWPSPVTSPCRRRPGSPPRTELLDRAVGRTLSTGNTSPSTRGRGPGREAPRATQEPRTNTESSPSLAANHLLVPGAVRPEGPQGGAATEASRHASLGTPVTSGPPGPVRSMGTPTKSQFLCLFLSLSLCLCLAIS